MKQEIKEIENNYLQIITNSKTEEKDKLFEKMKEEIYNIKNKLNLSYLLQKLDGIETNEIRLIIATTNHPEYIDPVLLRPGRFDINLKLDNCSCKIISEILSFYFKEEISESDILED
jgi:SpoVK/Ycf46/Vps4 family AAA+-type ATPase